VVTRNVDDIAQRVRFSIPIASVLVIQLSIISRIYVTETNVPIRSVAIIRLRPTYSTQYQ
jgi:hypothetical protein